MARKTKRAKLHLTDEQRVKLKRLSKSRKAPLREVQRAGILLHYADEMPVTQIQKLVNASRPAIYKCTGKALAAGIDAGLKDFCHRPFEPEINEAAKAWAVNSACARPEGHGLAAELRALNGPAKYTGPHAPAAGQPCLSKAAGAAIWGILSANEIRPRKIKYYPERRDPDSEQKMHEVLMVIPGR